MSENRGNKTRFARKRVCTVSVILGICSLNAMKFAVYVGFSPWKEQSFFWKISLNSCLIGLDQLCTGRAGGSSRGKAFNKILSPPSQWDFTNQKATQPETSPEVICSQSASLRMLGAILVPSSHYRMSENFWRPVVHVQKLQMSLLMFITDFCPSLLHWGKIYFLSSLQRVASLGWFENAALHSTWINW